MRKKKKEPFQEKSQQEAKLGAILAKLYPHDIIIMYVGGKAPVLAGRTSKPEKVGALIQKVLRRLLDRRIKAKQLKDQLEGKIIAIEQQVQDLGDKKKKKQQRLSGRSRLTILVGNRFLGGRPWLAARTAVERKQKEQDILQVIEKLRKMHPRSQIAFDERTGTPLCSSGHRTHMTDFLDILTPEISVALFGPRLAGGPESYQIAAARRTLSRRAPGYRYTSLRRLY